MQKKLFFSYLFIILLAIGISAIAFWSKGYNYIIHQGQDYYLTQAKLVADIFSQEDFETIEEYNTFVSQYADKYHFRVTIIDQKGQVYADSITDEPLENHASREEIVRALKGESVTVNRLSKTTGRQYSYSAVPVSNGDFNGVLRVSLPLSEIKSLNSGLMNSILYAVIFCFVIAILAAFVFMELLSKPIDEITKAAVRVSEGELGTKIYTREKNQIGRLAGAFNAMSVNLKNTVENLTQRNAELEAMLSSMTAGVIAINDSNEILLYNKAFLEISNISNKDIKGQSLYSLFRNAAVFDAIDFVRENNSSVMKEGAHNNVEYRSIRVTAAPLQREATKDSGVLLLIEDITQIKKLETMRSDFVSNVTHELKTPLTSIRGFIDTLKSGTVKDEAVVNKFLDIIDIEAERLYSLIQDILLLSEIESKIESERNPCDFNSIAEEVIELLRPKLPADVKFIMEPDSNLRPFYCNQDRMKQLLINLLDNAIKYTEKGSITLECKEENNKLKVAVRDTGIGIEQDHLARIFERFYRVDKGRSRKQGGTGLGLSIVKHIVELYNGDIQVKSEIGVGTEFILYLPYHNN